MIGWLLDTNVIASLIAANGAPSVKKWASTVDERCLYISVLTLAEYDKGIAALNEQDPDCLRYSALRDSLAQRFSDRVLPVSNTVVRRWRKISGRVKRDHGHPPAVIDTLIAATAIEFILYVVSRNIKDLQFSGAIIFNPWIDSPLDFTLTQGRSR